MGRVKSLERTTNVRIKNNKTSTRKEKILTPLKLTKGYLGIKLYDENQKGRMFRIHRLVAEAFISKNTDKEQVNHIDGNKENNCATNLEWCSQSENMKHSYRIGLRDKERLREHMRTVGKSKKGLEKRWRK